MGQVSLMAIVIVMETFLMSVELVAVQAFRMANVTVMETN